MSLHSWLSRPRHGQTKRTVLQVETLERRDVMSATLWGIGAGTYDLSQTFLLHSNPTAKHVVYLDFNGHTTGNVYGSGWDNLTSPAWDYSGNGASFTTAEQQIIQKVWARVAEDFAPFNVDVTTQDPGVEALRKSTTTDDRWGIRVVITPDDRPAPGSGGVAYIGSFNFNTDTPVYVFNTSEKSVAEAASHEVGHALGLNHDGTSSLGYYRGHGSGTTSWGPIMGASYTPNVTQWSKGEYSGANNKEDDLAKITTQNGFGYLSDDYGSTQATAFGLLSQGSSQVGPLHGIIERNTDADWFSFWSDGGQVSLDIDAFTLGPNLAVRADLYNSSGGLLTTVNSASSLNAALDYVVGSSGQYFLKVSGAGRGDPLTNGFSSYASLGNYRITGSVPAYTGGGGAGNSPPVANDDTATTLTGSPVSVNVLNNDSDPNGDVLTITEVNNVQNGTAVISGGAVVFTPNSGFTGIGSFTYTITDGNGGVASADASVTVNAPVTGQSFTNNTDVVISSTKTSTKTSSIRVSGLSGTVQDVNVLLNINHTWVSDLRITLIAPNGKRIILFERHGGGADNILNTTFDDAASTPISAGLAPYGGSFKPYQALSGMNGLNPNGTWKLEVRDYDRRDGGKIDNWTITLTTSSASGSGLGTGSARALSAGGLAATTSVPVSTAVLDRVWQEIGARGQAALQHFVEHHASHVQWLADLFTRFQNHAELEDDLPSEFTA